MLWKELCWAKMVEGSAMSDVRVQNEKSTGLSHRERLEAELQRYVSLLVSQYQPERILIFGSVASGDVGPWSDIDMIVIKRTDKPFMDRIADVLRIIQPREAIDVLVYTPEEFDKLCQERTFFREEIAKKAKVVYVAE